MIQKHNNISLYGVYCDACSESDSFGTDDFYELIRLMKYEDWGIIKAGTDWLHYCPACNEQRKRNYAKAEFKIEKTKGK